MIDHIVYVHIDYRNSTFLYFLISRSNNSTVETRIGLRFDNCIFTGSN